MFEENNLVYEKDYKPRTHITNMRIVDILGLRFWKNKNMRILWFLGTFFENSQK